MSNLDAPPLTSLPELQGVRPAGTNPPERARYRDAQRVLGRLFSRIQYEVAGVEHVPARGPAILVMNHTGWEEILLAMHAVPRAMRIVGMHELMHLDDPVCQARVLDTGYGRRMGRLPRHALVRLGTRFGARVRRVALEFGYIPTHVFTDSWRPRLGTNGVRTIVGALEAGEMVLLFPEGGYRRDGVMSPFKPGVGLIVRLLGRRGMRVPFVPAAQHTAGCVSWRLANRFVPRLVLGEPVVFEAHEHPTDRFDACVARELQDRVTALLPRAWPGGPRQTYV